VLYSRTPVKKGRGGEKEAWLGVKGRDGKERKMEKREGERKGLEREGEDGEGPGPHYL
jgi:hypothetical protein